MGFRYPGRGKHLLFPAYELPRVVSLQYLRDVGEFLTSMQALIDRSRRVPRALLDCRQSSLCRSSVIAAQHIMALSHSREKSMQDSIRDTGSVTSAQEIYRSEEYESPLGQLEQEIARAWGETFHLDQVGRNDNFFEFGGNSLIAMDLMEKLSSRLGMELPVVVLLQNPSPREMAAYISGSV